MVSVFKDDLIGLSFFARIRCSGCPSTATVEVTAVDVQDGCAPPPEKWSLSPGGYLCSPECVELAKKNAVDEAIKRTTSAVHESFRRYAERFK